MVANKKTTSNLLNFFSVALLIFLFSGNLYSQVTIGSNGTTIKGALLQLKEKEVVGAAPNATRGVGMPRLNLVSPSDLTPCVPTMTAADKLSHIGLTVYNLTENQYFCKGLYVWDGLTWIYLSNKPCVPCVEPVIVSCQFTSWDMLLSEYVTWDPAETTTVWQIGEMQQLEMTVVATSTAPLTYQWKKDGVDIPGATNAQYVIPSVEYWTHGQTDIGGAYPEYTCEVKGCKTITASAGKLYVMQMGPPPLQLVSDIGDYYLGWPAYLDVAQTQPAGCNTAPQNRNSANKLDLNHEYYVAIEYNWTGSSFTFEITDPHGLIDMSTVTNAPSNWTGSWGEGSAIGFKFKADAIEKAKGKLWSNGPEISIKVTDEWGYYWIQNNPYVFKLADCDCCY